MKAMVLDRPRTALVLVNRPDPTPGPGEIRVRVEACAVCRTDLHVVDGELPCPKSPLVPGHEIVGVVDLIGEGVAPSRLGQRVGIPWLGHTCGRCSYCTRAAENLCDQPGLIGWRCLKKAGDVRHLGLYGFGAAAHIITQVALWQRRRIFAFTRRGDDRAQEFARSLGAEWVGASDELPPVKLDAAIIFAPVGELVPAALRAVCKGGRVVCGGIHMSDIPSMPYELLWQEREVLSVANLTRSDAQEFFPIAQQAGVHTYTTTYRLEDANQALDDLRTGRLNGAAVLQP